MHWRPITGSNSTRPSMLDAYKNKTPYELLNVNEDTPTGEIREAYRKLMKVYHPDKSHAFLKETNEEIAKLLNLAFERIMRDRHERR